MSAVFYWAVVPAPPTSMTGLRRKQAIPEKRHQTSANHDRHNYNYQILHVHNNVPDIPNAVRQHKG